MRMNDRYWAIFTAVVKNKEGERLQLSQASKTTKHKELEVEWYLRVGNNWVIKAIYETVKEIALIMED